MNKEKDKHLIIFEKFIENKTVVMNVSKFKTNDRVNLFTVYSRFENAAEVSSMSANSLSQIMKLFAEAVFQLNNHIIRRISKFNPNVLADENIKFLDIFKSVQHEDFTNHTTTFEYLKNTGVLLIYLSTLVEVEDNKRFYEAMVYIILGAVNDLQKFNNLTPYYKGVAISFERETEIEPGSEYFE